MTSTRDRQVIYQTKVKDGIQLSFNDPKTSGELCLLVLCSSLRCQDPWDVERERKRKFKNRLTLVIKEPALVSALCQSQFASACIKAKSNLIPHTDHDGWLAAAPGGQSWQGVRVSLGKKKEKGDLLGAKGFCASEARDVFVLFACGPRPLEGTISHRRLDHCPARAVLDPRSNAGPHGYICQPYSTWSSCSIDCQCQM